MTIAEALSAEVERQGVTVYRLAKLTGMSAGRVHGILTGGTVNPGILTVRKLLDALGKSLAWLERKCRE
jgi:putative transcriptional regulator